MSDPRHDLGRRAEDAVATWLAGSGWRILARRWRVAEGELDLVCLDPSRCLVGVEVRARRSARAGLAEESIDSRRLGRLRAALRRYFREEAIGSPRGLRLDLVTVVPTAGDPGRWRLRRHANVDGW